MSTSVQPQPNRPPPAASISSPSTPSAPWPWTRCRRPTPAIPARRWRMAPVAYCLWQRFLRFDPDDPIWPNRDRFVLSAGHASMLLYSLLHLTGVKAVDPRIRDARRAVASRSTTSSTSASSTANAPAIPSIAGPPASKPPPARSARAWPPASAWPSPAGGWRSTSTGPASSMFDYDVYALCGDGCMMEGISQRGRFARRPPEARQPLLDLRQQPHHHRGQHRAGLQRGRGHALHRLRLERHARRRRQRPGDAGPRASTSSKHTHGPARR